MGQSFNQHVIMGNLGSDPTMRDVGQRKVTAFAVATTEEWYTDNGQKNEKTTWHKVNVWGRQAENCAKYLSKGSKVLCIGRTEDDNWETKEGDKRTTKKFNAQTVKFLGSPNRNGTQSSRQDPYPDQGGYGGPETPGVDDIPF